MAPKDEPELHLAASALAAVINFPLWKASAIAQAGFKMKSGGSARRLYWLAMQPPYKGVLAVKGSDQKYVFQGVGMLFSGEFSNFEWAPDEPRESRFVIIGRNLDEKELVDGNARASTKAAAAAKKKKKKSKPGDENGEQPCAQHLPC